MLMRRKLFLLNEITVSLFLSIFWDQLWLIIVKMHIYTVYQYAWLQKLSGVSKYQIYLNMTFCMAWSLILNITSSFVDQPLHIKFHILGSNLNKTFHKMYWWRNNSVGVASFISYSLKTAFASLFTLRKIERRIVNVNPVTKLIKSNFTQILLRFWYTNLIFSLV